MIHSLAGGELKEYSRFDIAKVEYLDTQERAFALVACPNIVENDLVIVDFNGQEREARVLRVDKNVYEQNFPISVKRLKKIVRKV